MRKSETKKSEIGKSEVRKTIYSSNSKLGLGCWYGWVKDNSTLLKIYLRYFPGSSDRLNRKSMISYLSIYLLV